MKTCRFGVLGAGNMGTAIVEGAVRAGLFPPAQALLFNRSAEKREKNREKGFAVTGDYTEVYTACDTVVLGVKPQNFDEILPVLSGCRCEKPLVVSDRGGHNVCEDRARARRGYAGCPRDAEHAAHAGRGGGAACEKRGRDTGAA